MEKKPTIEEKLAMLVAVFFLIVGFSIYLFPWVVPFIWDLPEGMTAPYYGVLVAIELAPVASKWRENLHENEKD